MGVVVRGECTGFQVSWDENHLLSRTVKGVRVGSTVIRGKWGQCSREDVRHEDGKEKVGEGDGGFRSPSTIRSKAEKGDGGCKVEVAEDVADDDDGEDGHGPE